VDPATQKRVAFQISEEGTEEETRRFFVYLREMGLSVKGVTTDGSPLYPKVIAEVFPGAKHQVCRFHILKEINLLVLRALAGFRKALPKPPRRKRGRPRKGEEVKPTSAEILKRKVWENRYLWVRHHLTESEHARLQEICHRQPLLRALRELVDLVYNLFDRRCHMETALGKLEVLRKLKVFREFPQLLPIWKKLRSKNLEKALLFLNDEFLEGTSNAVERANRAYRKIQKTVYRVRARHMIEGRIKLDMLLEKDRRDRQEALKANANPFWARFAEAA
jgi:transposase-like protein